MSSHRLLEIGLLCLVASGPCLAPPARAADGSSVPRVVLVAQRGGTEITDLLVPYALLAAAGAEVIVAATEPGRVSLWPTLSLEVETALEGVGTVDLVVVPAVRDPRDPALVGAVRALHGSGARVASICDGVFVLAEAGLLDGVPATGHFYSRGRRGRRYPEVRWLDDRRYVEAGTILTSAGVSASGPAAVRLVEVLFGPERAAAVAERYGIERGAEHDSEAFRVGAPQILTALGNYLRGIAKRPYRLQIDDGVDEYSLAFAVDMLARTSRASIALGSGTTVRTAFGLELRGTSGPAEGLGVRLPQLRAPDRSGPSVGSPWALGAGSDADALSIADPRDALPALHAHLRTHFGRSTAEFVALQLELPAAR